MTDIDVLSRVLSENGADYTVISDSEADIYSPINITELTLSLSSQNCVINSVSERGENLESYYMNLLGGGKNE